jgi:hypothetical protein
MARGQSQSSSQSARSEISTKPSKENLDNEIWRERPIDKFQREKRLTNQYPDLSNRNKALNFAAESVSKISKSTKEILSKIKGKNDEFDKQTIVNAITNLAVWQNKTKKEIQQKAEKDFGDQKAINKVAPRNESVFTPNQRTALELASSNLNQALYNIEIVQEGQGSIDRYNAKFESPVPSKTTTMEDVYGDIKINIKKATRFLDASTIN